jgi:hypothetical protein
MNRDQNDVAPDVILGSAVIRIPDAFLEVALAWQAVRSAAVPSTPGWPRT